MKNKAKIAFSVVASALVLAIVIVNSGLLPARAANSNSLSLASGSSQYVSITDGSQTGLDLTGNFTLEAWVNFTSLPTGGGSMGIISKWVNPNYQYELDYIESGGAYQLRLSIYGTAQTSQTLNYTFTQGTWYHLAVAFDSSAGTADVYVNGNNVGQMTGFTEAARNSSSDFQIGALNSISYFNGLIDDVRVWNTKRTGPQIATDFTKELAGTEANLQGYWKFSSSLQDETSNNNDLTGSGSPTYSSSLPFPGPFARKTTDQSITSNTTLQNDADLALAVAKNTTYIVEGTIVATSVSAVPDLKIAFTAPSGSTLRIGYIVAGGPSSGGVLTSSGAESDAVALLSSVPSAIFVQGTVLTGSTDGLLTLQWAQNQSNSSATTLLAGSYLRVQQVLY